MSLDRVVGGARRLATAGRHQFVGTEHLVASLLELPDGPLVGAVASAGIVPAAAAEALLAALRRRPEEEAEPVDIPISRNAQQLIDATEREAVKRGTEADERLLAEQLLKQPRGRVASVLGRTPDSLKAIQSALLGAQPNSASSAKVAPPRERRPKPGRAEPAPRSAAPKPAPRPAASEPEAPRIVASIRPAPRRPFQWSLLLLAAVPVSFYLHFTNGDPALAFGAACLAMVPLAALMGDATEAIADRSGPTVGGLINAAFGNAAELIIALFALRAGMLTLVKASITGSILGNLLLILGASFVAGGGKREIVRFNRANAGMSAAMLALAVIGLVFPALFHASGGASQPAAELRLSEAVAGILIVTYLASLVFSLRTHKALFGGGDHPEIFPRWTTPVAWLVLGAATVLVGFESDFLVQVVEPMGQRFHLSQMFIGLILVPIIGNAAEHASAVVVARKGQADLALQIALGSSTQVALFVAPVLVFAGLGFGAGMNLVFSTFEVAALGVSTIVIAIITLDGEAHWFEGFQLLAVYAMIGAAAWVI